MSSRRISFTFSMKRQIYLLIKEKKSLHTLTNRKLDKAAISDDRHVPVKLMYFWLLEVFLEL